uniref:Uncharacterized protein n=1 Tax=Meloidogyne enterolobii TaxID=390850 RepID=A0A6V7W6R3_MELEN|nr:unnamed protein product [Meloidogyne enterolobii]
MELITDKKVKNNDDTKEIEKLKKEIEKGYENIEKHETFTLQYGVKEAIWFFYKIVYLTANINKLIKGKKLNVITAIIKNKNILDFYNYMLNIIKEI